MKFLIEFINDYFGVDAAYFEVVRCRDCVHSINSKGRMMCKRQAEIQYGEWLGLTATEADHYCSYGRRKE